MQNVYFFWQVLALVGQCLDGPGYLHAPYHLSKSGKALSVRIPFASEIQGWLVANANEKFGGGSAGLHAGHGDHSIGMDDSGEFGAFMDDGSFGIKNIILKESPLDHLDFHLAIWLVIHSDHSVEEAVCISSFLHVRQKILRRYRGQIGVKLHHYLTHGSIDSDLCAGGILTGKHPRQKHRQDKKGRFIPACVSE